MCSWLNSTLRIRLVVLILLAVVPALGLILYTASEQRRTSTAAAREQTLRMARLAANTQKQVIEGTRQLLMMLSQMPVVNQGKSTECNQFLAEILKQHSDYDNFAVLDAQGKTICAGIPYSGSAKATDRSYFQRALATRKFAVGDYQIGHATKKATLNFAYPILDKAGQVQTLVIAALDLARLNQSAVPAKMPQDSVLNVIDRKGTFLVRYPNAQTWVGKPLPQHSFTRMKIAQGEGLDEVTSLDGVRRIFAFVPIGDDPRNPDEYIRVGVPKFEVFADADRLLVRNLTALGVVTFLALLAAWVGGDIFIIQQIQSLVQTAKTLGSGQLNTRTELPYTSGELGQLAQAIDEMAAALEAREMAIASISQNMQTLFELIPIGILITEDLEFKKVKSNPAFAEILGISPEVNASHTPVDSPPPSYKIVQEGKELLPEEYPLRYAAIHNTEVKGTEVDIVRGDGSVFNLFGYATPLRNKQGNSRGAVAAFLNITERKQMEQALRQTEQRLRLAQRAGKIGTWEWNLRTNEVSWSEGIWDLLGLEIGTEEPGVKPWLDFIHPDDSPRIMQGVEKVIDEGSEYYDEFRIIRKDHTVIWLASKGQIIRDANGQAERFLGVNIDITERKQAEEEREDLLLREQAAREVAETANRIKDEFLAVLSHELRTPLNPILGWIKLLRTHQLDEHKQALALETIERNAKLQTQLIGDLLDISRILQGKLTLNMSPVNLAVTIAAAKETVRLAAEAKSIQIHTEIAPDVQLFMGDAGRLQQVVWNLLSNAVKFTPAGGKVNIKLESTNTCTQIQVSDTGKGITPEFLPYVFETFRQADSATTRKFGGLGLGLAIVRNIVEMHGGTVHVDSPGEDQGATFTVKLPLMATSVQPAENQTSVKTSLNLLGLRVLVVEDEKDTRELLVFTMQQCGAKVIDAASAHEAFKILKQYQPEILVCDIGMPEMDGYAFIRQLRTFSKEQGGQIPAIALTAYAGESDQKQALAAGFQRHLSKPIDFEELVEAIMSLSS
jgi:PAS domain S-box-containing protein